MYYNVAQLLKESVGSTRTYRVDEAVSVDDDTQISATGQIALMRTDKGIWVDAGIEMGVWLTCSRCLKRSASPLRLVIEEEYLPTVDINTGQPLNVPEKAEGSFTIGPQHVLDLREALRQYRLTNQPMKPLCDEECRGLCPICGANRNEAGACSCQGEGIDTRWGPLSKLFGENRG